MKRDEQSEFTRNAILLFLALRAGDLVNVAGGMWFVPRYVSPEEIGAVLPVTSFATFLSLPVFAFAMVMMRESAVLSSRGERGELKSLLTGMFIAGGIVLLAALGVSAAIAPAFLKAMGVSDQSAGTLVVLAAFLGCMAPVYTDALQALKRFGTLGAVELAGAAVRFLTMTATMPAKALAGYFAGQAALPLFRIAGSVFALRRELSVPSRTYWNARTAKRIAAAFLAVAAYQAFPMGASLAEQSILRTCLSTADSAGYYMISRFSDFLHCISFPLLLVMFPYTATAARRNVSTRPFVIKCSLATILAAAAMAAAYALAGEELLSLMPNGEHYAGYARYMPWLVLVTALTSCQVFYTNAEVSAGRHGFLTWLVPLHLVYPAALWFAGRGGADLRTLLWWFTAASLARFAFSVAGLVRQVGPPPTEEHR